MTTTSPIPTAVPTSGSMARRPDASATTTLEPAGPAFGEVLARHAEAPRSDVPRADRRSDGGTRSDTPRPEGNERSDEASDERPTAATRSERKATADAAENSGDEQPDAPTDGPDANVRAVEAVATAVAVLATTPAQPAGVPIVAAQEVTEGVEPTESAETAAPAQTAAEATAVVDDAGVVDDAVVVDDLPTPAPEQPSTAATADATPTGAAHDGARPGAVTDGQAVIPSTEPSSEQSDIEVSVTPADTAPVADDAAPTAETAQVTTEAPADAAVEPATDGDADTTVSAEEAPVTPEAPADAGDDQSAADRQGPADGQTVEELATPAPRNEPAATRVARQTPGSGQTEAPFDRSHAGGAERSVLARAELQRATAAGRRLEVGLNTADLGRVRITAVDGADGLQLQLSSDRPDGRARLGENLQELRSDLDEQGIGVGSLEVGTGDADRHQFGDGLEPGDGETRHVHLVDIPQPVAAAAPSRLVPHHVDGLDLRL